MEHLPIYIGLVFGLTTLVTIWVLYKSNSSYKITFVVLLFWSAFQSMLGVSGFYTIVDTLPPRLILLIAPPLLLMILLFATKQGRNYIDSLNLKTLTILHIIRIPVEVVLFMLFVHKAVPELMTFEGRNFDIISGITAPLVYYFGFVNKQLNNKMILLWNFICLGLLMNVVTHGVLSAPSVFQKLAFDQPNIAVLHFPFVWLPSVVVPIVLFSHLVAIRQLLRAKKTKD